MAGVAIASYNGNRQGQRFFRCVCEAGHIGWRERGSHCRTTGGEQRVVRTLVLCGLVALTVHSAKAAELKVGDRVPAASGEAITVANDGGLKRQAQVLDLGKVCHVNGWTKNWLLVRRIVGDWTLLELVGPSPGDEPNIDYPSSIAAECPLGTETTRPLAEMRARLNEYAHKTDLELIKSLQDRPRNHSLM